jgi:RNA polymerase sigma-B factor
LRATSGSPGASLEDQLLRRYRDGDVAARDELVTLMQPLARRLAARYRHTTEPLEDLEQVAYIGLIKAIDRFDPDLGSFVRYAVPTILGELKRHFRDRGWTMHVSRSLQERFMKVGDAVDELTTTLGRSPKPRDIAEATGFTLEEVLEALDVSSAYAPAALDAPRGGEDESGTLGDAVGGIDHRYELVELGASLEPALRALPPRERAILHMRFSDYFTLWVIAVRMGISLMQVSRLLRRSIERLSAAAR